MMTSITSLLDTMIAVPRHPAVIDVMARIRGLIAMIPEDPGVDGDQSYVIAIEMDDLVTRLYTSGAVACMNEGDRGTIKAVKDGVSRAKNKIFQIIGLPPDPW